MLLWSAGDKAMTQMIDFKVNQKKYSYEQKMGV